MILLTTTSSLLKISLGGTVTTNQLVFTSHYVDINSTSFTPGSTDGLTNNTTQVSLIPSPSSGLVRQTKYVSVFNADTVAQTVTVTLNNGTDRTVLSVLLQAGYSLTYNIESGWQVTDKNGSIQYVGNTGPTGAAGANGTNGTNGTNGINAYTTTSANFTQPAISSTVSVTVGGTAWMALNEIIFVQDGSGDGGYYSVNSITDSTHVVLKNLGYSGNSASSTTINSGPAVTPGGIQGTNAIPDYLYLTNN